MRADGSGNEGVRKKVYGGGPVTKYQPHIH
jgi:hypothetical protein